MKTGKEYKRRDKLKVKPLRVRLLKDSESKF